MATTLPPPEEPPFDLLDEPTFEVAAEPVGEIGEPFAAPEVAAPPLPSSGPAPETIFAARVPPALPVRPAPTTRRAVFFDVENTSRAEHIARVLTHLQLDWVICATELVAVGNWRVVGHDAARLLAQQGAHLVHSAPATGVRDWSDLRIAVAAGVWLATARPGDAIEIITDDQAFDAVGDVASSLGVRFRRLSYRALAGVHGEMPLPVSTGEERSGGRRSRRGGRGGRGGRRSGGGRVAPPPPPPPLVTNGAEPEDEESHTAPHDEIVAVIRDLIEQSPARAVGLDALSNALKARGFRRTPGSPRLITRLRRIKEVAVGGNGTVRLVDEGGGGEVAESPGEGAYVPAGADAGAGGDETAGESPGPRRRRRRRGGRRRRGRGGGGGQAVVAAP